MIGPDMLGLYRPVGFQTWLEGRVGQEGEVPITDFKILDQR